MFIRNNPNVDFDTLEQEVTDRIETYRQALDSEEVPEFDAGRLQSAKVDMAQLQHTNVDGGLNLLYSLEDRDFVYYAYNLFLGRPPTEREAASCTERVRAGENKTRIACELRYSDEGQGRNENISLRIERIVYKLISLPVIGRLFDILSIIASLPTLKTISQAKENHAYRVIESIKADISRNNQQLAELNRRLQEIERGFGESEVELQALKTGLDDAQSAIASSRARLSLIERARSATTAPLDSNHQSAANSTYTDDPMYVAFEEQYRGSTANIRGRLGYYLPQLQKTFASLDANCSRILDVGCGRGEWLKLLQENGYEAVGVDTNALNISSCEQEGLTAMQDDAIAWLSRQEDASLACISAFHVIEHLDFSQLNYFIDQALRCLCPGGLILLETPNPENLLVGTNAFYLDPTHVRPLPHGLMNFLLSYKGFRDVSVHKLHPVASDLMIHEESEVARRCNELFYEAQDYAIVANKPQV